MEEEISACAVTSDEDHLHCLAENLRRPDARLKVDGELWGMCWGKADPLNAKLADLIDPAVNSIARITAERDALAKELEEEAAVHREIREGIEEASARFMAERDLAVKLVQAAYSEGFSEGMREANPNSYHGGKGWHESKTRAALVTLASTSSVASDECRPVENVKLGAPLKEDDR